MAPIERGPVVSLSEQCGHPLEHEFARRGVGIAAFVVEWDFVGVRVGSKGAGVERVGTRGQAN